MGGVRREGVKRLSRGQSHDVLTRLENVGLSTGIAAEIVDGSPRYARAMLVAVSGSEWWSHRVLDWWQQVGFAIQNARREEWIREHGLAALEGMTDAQRDVYMHDGAFTVPGYGSHRVTTGVLVERMRDGWGLFYMPPERDLPKEWFAEHVEDSPTLYESVDRARIRWEFRERGYWFWLKIENRVTPGRHPSPDHLATLVGEAEGHPDATDAEAIVDVLGGIISETCASLEEFVLAHECGIAVGWSSALHDEALLLRSEYVSDDRSRRPPRRLVVRRTFARIGCLHYGDDEFLKPPGACNPAVYRCAVERIA